MVQIWLVDLLNLELSFNKKGLSKFETTKQLQIKYLPLTHAYGHWLADVQLAGFAPAFTLSFHDSECFRKPPMPIASVVMGQCKKQEDKVFAYEKSLTNCPLFDIKRLFGFDRLLTSDSFSGRTIPRRLSKERF